MNLYPRRECKAEAYVEATARGYRAKCPVCPREHQGPERKSRNKAVSDWNEMQKAQGTQ